MINKNKYLRVFVDFKQITKVSQDWAELFEDIKVSVIADKTRRYLSMDTAHDNLRELNT